MVHMKTILAIAIILIIQANGNEVVLQGQGRDGTFNEIRKHEALPGGGSSIMITRRMFGSPVKTFKTFKTTLGGLGASLGAGTLFAGLPSPFNVNSQFGLTAPSGLAPQLQETTRWNSITPWSQIQQPSASSQWNLPSQSSSNNNMATLGLPNNGQWNSQSSSNNNLATLDLPNSAPWNSQSSSNNNMATLGLPNNGQWNSQSSSNNNMATLGLPNNAQWNSGPQFGFQNNDNSQFGLNPLPSGGSQWSSSSSQNDFNPSPQSPFGSQWGSSGPSIYGSNINLNAQPQVNYNYNPDPSMNYNHLLSAPSAPDAGSQQGLFSQFDSNSNSVPGIPLNSLQNNYAESQQQQNQNPWLGSQSMGGSTNYFQGSPTMQGQQGMEQLLSQIPSQGPSAGSSWGSSWGSSQQLPMQGYQQFLNNPQSLASAPLAWGKSEASSSLGKRSTDEVEEDNAEEEWLKN